MGVGPEASIEEASIAEASIAEASIEEASIEEASIESWAIASGGGGVPSGAVVAGSSHGAPRGPGLRAVVDRAGGGVDGLRALARHVEPSVLARDRRFEVVPELAELLPLGLERGSTLGCAGPGAVSMAFAVAAGPVATGSWLAVIGGQDLNLVAAEQAGVALHRTIVVAEPPRSSWGAVTSALIDAFDIVVVATPSRVPLRDVRRLSTRLRERGGLVIDVGGGWPEAHDHQLRVTAQAWAGLGRGHGVITGRRVRVAVSGRRGVRPREVEIRMPGSTAVPCADPVDHPVDDSRASFAGDARAGFAGCDIERLVALDEEAEPIGDGTTAPLRRVG